MATETIEVTVTLIGNGYTEHGAIFLMDPYSNLRTLFTRLKETLTLVMQIRPEIEAIIFTMDNFEIKKTTKQLKIELTEAEQNERNRNPFPGN